MTELTPEQRRELDQDRKRDSDFGGRVRQFNQELVDTITPESDPKKVLAVMWALGNLLYDYTDAPFGRSIDPSTVDETAAIAIEAFSRFAGLDNLSEDEIQDIRSDGGAMARRYLDGFPTHTPE